MEQERTNESDLTSGRMFSRLAVLLPALEAALSMWILHAQSGPVFLSSVILYGNFYYLQTLSPTGVLNLIKAHGIFTLLLLSERVIYGLAWISTTLASELLTDISRFESTAIVHAAIHNAVKHSSQLPDLDFITVIFLLIAYSYFYHTQKGREDKFLAATVFWTLRCMFSGQFGYISIAFISCTTSLWIVHKRIYATNYLQIESLQNDLQNVQ